MADYTKITVKKELYERLKILAAAENRSVANYIENLVGNIL